MQCVSKHTNLGQTGKVAEHRAGSPYLVQYCTQGEHSDGLVEYGNFLYLRQKQPAQSEFYFRGASVYILGAEKQVHFSETLETKMVIMDLTT